MLKNGPPILARSKIWRNKGEWTRLWQEKLQKEAKEDKGRESISVFCVTDGLCKDVHAGATWVMKWGEKTKRSAIRIALDI